MKKQAYILLSAALISSCSFMGVMERGNGVAVENTLELEEFSELSLPAAVDVVYTQAEGEQSVVFSCDENLLDYYYIRVEGNTLVAGVKPGVLSLSAKAKTVLTVTSPVLDEVRLSGSGDCIVNGSVYAENDFCLKTSGSGDILVTGPIDCGGITVSSTGSGDIEVNGIIAGSGADIRTSGSGDIDIKSLVAPWTSVKSTGSGDIELHSLKADDVTAHTSGSGDITIFCNDAGVVDASTSGSGDIYLSGSAQSLKSRHSGSGDVISKHLTIL